MAIQPNESEGGSTQSLIDNLIQGLNYRGVVWRGDAIKRLVEIDRQTAIPILLRILQVDESTHVRSIAAEALGEIGDATTISQLTQALMDDEDRGVRGYAAEALSKLTSGTPEVSQALLQALLEDIHVQSSPLAYQAAQALKDMSNFDTATLELIKVLESCYSSQQFENPYNQNLRLKTIKVLGILGDTRAVPVLLKALLEPQLSHFSVALQALEKIEGIDRETVISGLVKAFEYYKQLGRQPNRVNRCQMLVELAKKFDLNMEYE